MSTKVKLRCLQAGGIVASVAPLATVVGLNWENYVQTSRSAVGLTVGGIMLVFLVAVQMLGKARKVFGNGVVVTGFIFVLVCLLEPIILELKLLTGMMLAGQGLNLGVQVPVRRLQKRLDDENTAKVTSNGVSAALERFSGRV